MDTCLNHTLATRSHQQGRWVSGCLRVLERWVAAWAQRAEARWANTDLRSRYY